MSLRMQSYFVCCRSYDACRCAERAIARAKRAERKRNRAEPMFDPGPVVPPEPKTRPVVTSMPEGGMF